MTVIGAAVVFVSVPDIFPLPLAAIPVTPAVLSLVQLYVVPVVVLVNAIVVIGLPEHTVWLEGVATAFGNGLTVSAAAVENAVGQLYPAGPVITTSKLPASANATFKIV